MCDFLIFLHIWGVSVLCIDGHPEPLFCWVTSHLVPFRPFPRTIWLEFPMVPGIGVFQGLPKWFWWAALVEKHHNRILELKDFGKNSEKWSDLSYTVAGRMDDRVHFFFFFFTVFVSRLMLLVFLRTNQCKCLSLLLCLPFALLSGLKIGEPATEPDVHVTVNFTPSTSFRKDSDSCLKCSSNIDHPSVLILLPPLWGLPLF